PDWTLATLFVSVFPTASSSTASAANCCPTSTSTPPSSATPSAAPSPAPLKTASTPRCAWRDNLSRGSYVVTIILRKAAAYTWDRGSSLDLQFSIYLFGHLRADFRRSKS